MVVSLFQGVSPFGESGCNSERMAQSIIRVTTMVVGLYSDIMVWYDNASYNHGERL